MVSQWVKDPEEEIEEDVVEDDKELLMAEETVEVEIGKLEDVVEVMANQYLLRSQGRDKFGTHSTGE